MKKFLILVILSIFPTGPISDLKTDIPEYGQTQQQTAQSQSNQQIINACNKIKNPDLRRKCLSRLK